MMRDKDLYATILGVASPWAVFDVELRSEAEEVEVFIEHDGRRGLACPKCGRVCARHDTRRRSWRHLSVCTIIEGAILTLFEGVEGRPPGRAGEVWHGRQRVKPLRGSSASLRPFG